MKIALILIAALSFFGVITYNLKTSEDKTESGKTTETSAPQSQTMVEKRSPVLVELFTSEGCSSCPPADKNLIEFNEKQPFAEANVITLSMHVDYWNRLGWTDPFSSAQFSQRQGFYSNTFNLGEVYTPQMVVDGMRQFVGGNSDEARKAINQAVKSPKASVELSIAAGNKLKVKISAIPAHSFSNVFVAIAEDNILTSVRNGENGGRTLPHDSVVRELRTIGSLSEKDNNFETEALFRIQSTWKRGNLKAVVFVQVEKDSQIIGVNQIKL